MADAQLFEENFIVTKVNKEKYDRVHRLSGTSTDGSLTFTLDINHELWPVAEGTTINIVLATTLALDGTTKEGAETSWRNVSRSNTATLADLFEYVCYGKNYRFEDAEAGAETVKYYASFGGMLLYIEGPYRKLNGLKIDEIYMLCKKA
ncbi:DNA-directed RNA polymerases I/II/III subunit RPABC3 [Parastagonospora nodorum]|nr:DNA-directed RNA polymerases I/II/III subunit RPABC3 [Parastagonospora nodorum]KAH4002478.1 DNA-directed RNA polymerases I/II/III subunit RPABC3 [Parastagonospora nodorum]KAH4025906.1 DNA-directed RNA polymerases I/II/III subunit RPABC3 [Parastagonospora nodorum]KAH4036057.1 DNA-directed RNA polymerases I/II/III subunit RPABC3 [Parastagonospora nodorum]KAH4050247.1 DNA-directed RNA polymerases I/II/III subunit RPABC3 [Parastagonospora nodorum]